MSFACSARRLFWATPIISTYVPVMSVWNDWASFINSWGGTGPILTDSGGFQVFSLSALNKIDDEGVTFSSHFRWWPAPVCNSSFRWRYKARSGAILSWHSTNARLIRRRLSKSKPRCGERWLGRSVGSRPPLKSHQARFGIVQGGLFEIFAFNPRERLRHSLLTGLQSVVCPLERPRS